jgi:GntR family transcriptional regulator
MYSCIYQFHSAIPALRVTTVQDMIAADMTAHRGAPVPAYYRVQELLRRRIEERQWKPGDAIPPERAIAQEQGLSIGTVKKAILNLVREGYLYRIQGKGTFVAGTTLKRGSLRYYRMTPGFGEEAAPLRISLLGMGQIDGFEPASRHLAVPRRQRLYELRRLFSTGDRPLVYSVSYLPRPMFKDLDKFPAETFETGTLYETIEKNYGLPCLRNHELFGVAAAGPDAAKSLRIPAKTPVLCIEMLTYTYKDVPYEYRKSWCVTDRWRVFREIE